MVEFTKEEEERYKERLKAREERRAREEQAHAKDEQPKKSPFKSRLGQKFAGAIDHAAGTAEAYRAKADYVTQRAGRIKKAIIPTAKPRHVQHGQRVVVRRPARPVRSRRGYYQPPPPTFRQARPPGETINDFIHGSRQSARSDPMDSFIGLNGGKKSRGNREFFRDFIG